MPITTAVLFVDAILRLSNVDSGVVKSIMTFGILLMLLQSIAIFFKDIAKVLDREI